MTELSENGANAMIEKIQALSSDEPAAHFLLASLYTAANEKAPSDIQWKAFHAAFVAWQTKTQSTPSAGTGQDLCKAHRYSACAASLQRQNRLTDSPRLLLGKTQFALPEYESAADSLGPV